jgi:transposase
MTAGSPTHLPIVKEYARRLGLEEIVDRTLDCGMRAGAGKIFLGLVMNVLSGRSPLYRVEEFFGSRDAALLLGLEARSLNDDALGRVLDRIYEYGTWKMFSEVCLRAFREFGIDGSVVHQDTTSVSVWGEYAPMPGDPIHITFGFSKDKRQDLKQFIVSLLCVEGNLPCHAEILDGNAADKKINGRILADLPRIMSRHGVEEFIYVADSALATQENFSLLGDIRFITRLPETFGACGRLVRKATSPWLEVGRLTSRKVRGRETGACYRLREEQVELYGRTYRAVVVHSDAHDQRRQKRLDKAVAKDKAVVTAKAEAFVRKEFFCLRDAQAAAEALSPGAYHHFSCSFETRPVYGRGRPPKNGHRRLHGRRHRVVVSVIEDRAAIEKLREEAGCFVLLTNVPADRKSGLEILRLYKDQDGVERNFGFLKDPLVANDVFLKKPRRIEAMGLVLVVALLLWRLMERAMRQKNVSLPGWNNRGTTRPTGFMMASKFSSVFVWTRGERRFLLRPLDETQRTYLQALNVSPAVFTEMASGAGRFGA